MSHQPSSFASRSVASIRVGQSVHAHPIDEGACLHAWPSRRIRAGRSNDVGVILMRGCRQSTSPCGKGSGRCEAAKHSTPSQAFAKPARRCKQSLASDPSRWHPRAPKQLAAVVDAPLPSKGRPQGSGKARRVAAAACCDQPASRRRIADAGLQMEVVLERAWCAQARTRLATHRICFVGKRHVTGLCCARRHKKTAWVLQAFGVRRILLSIT